MLQQVKNNFNSISFEPLLSGFIGLSLVTTKEEMLRALLESIAFSQKQLVEAFLSETDYKFEKLVVDGGVARNDFILQMIANLTGLRNIYNLYNNKIIIRPARDTTRHCGNVSMGCCLPCRFGSGDVGK